MNIEDYFGASTGSSPSSDCVGVESEWLRVGDLSVPCGELWAGDSCPTKRKDGCTAKVPVGVHGVWIKGMDFNGHRRTARARVVAASVPEPLLGEACGEIHIDGGSIAFCDIAAFEQVVLRRYKKQFYEEFNKVSMAAFFESYGIGCKSFSYGGRSIDVAFMPSGLGDGTYTVYQLRSGPQVVGAEVEFLSPNYKAPRRMEFSD